MDLKPIPTTYGGVNYRSRLEARWAAMFELLGWEHQYEPYDLSGWIPDFLLVSFNVLVEVKPTTIFPVGIAKEIDRAIQPERHGDGRYKHFSTPEPMILGCVCPVDQHGIDVRDGQPIGWMRGTPRDWNSNKDPVWGRAIVQGFESRWLNREKASVCELTECRPDNDAIHDIYQYIGLCHENDIDLTCDPGSTPPSTCFHEYADCRNSRFNAKPISWSVAKQVPLGGMHQGVSRIESTVTKLWIEAGNRVQWQSNTKYSQRAGVL